MKTVSPSEVKRFCTECLKVAGASPAHAESLASVLVQADVWGHLSYGISRLAIYVQDIQLKLCDGTAIPTVIKDTTATAWVDGKNSLGPVVGNFCMDVAMKKAKDCGIGWVVAKDSNHYGIASWYSMQALKYNMLGITFSNGPPMVPPTRSKKCALGSNPISIAAPAKDGDSFVLDIATSTAAFGTERKSKKNIGLPFQDMRDDYQPLGPMSTSSISLRNLKLTQKKLKLEVKKTTKKPTPMPLAQGPVERPKDDLVKLSWKIEDLLPLGGEEITSGYKGYGLALLVETFCGILAGSDYGPNIRHWNNTTRSANLAQCFVVVNPAYFAPGFEQRMSEMNSTLRHLEPFNLEKPVLVPGDPERKHMEIVKMQGGILYTDDQLKVAAQLAEKLKVTPLKVL